MEAAVTDARRLWAAIEPLHAVAYFDPTAIGTLEAAGLRGFWMGYFAGRFAPLGALPAGPVTALAFGFAPGRVARAIPDAWAYATPETVVAARIGGATRALSAHLAAEVPPEDLVELADLLDRAADACACDGRALAAGWSVVAPPEDLVGDPLARLWAAATILREHRGDGHVLTAVALGLRGIDTTVTHVATGAVEGERLRSTRGWTDAEWTDSVERLRAQGVLDGEGRLTDAGAALRRELEAGTDRLAADPVAALGPDGLARALALAVPMSRRLVDSGVVPVPNPIGVPRP